MGHSQKSPRLKGIRDCSEIRRSMKEPNEDGRPEGRPCIQHGKAGLSPSWRRGNHRFRRRQEQPFSSCCRRTSTRKRRRLALRQQERPSCRKRTCRNRSSCWSMLRQHQERHLRRRNRSKIQQHRELNRHRIRSNWRFGSRRGGPWPRER